MPFGTKKPTGRPPLTPTLRRVKQRLEDGAEDAVDELRALMKCDNPKVRLGAVTYWLDRALGRPAQSIQVEQTPSELPRHEQMAMLSDALEVLKAEDQIEAAAARAATEQSN